VCRRLVSVAIVGIEEVRAYTDCLSVQCFALRGDAIVPRLSALCTPVPELGLLPLRANVSAAKGRLILSRIWERIRRRIQVERNLFLEYEVSPHRAFLAKVPSKDLRFINKDSNLQSTLANIGDPDLDEVGNFIPFKQACLQGQVNRLRPPIHVETVFGSTTLSPSLNWMYPLMLGSRDRIDGSYGR
jgi:hypothetical protein